MIKKTLISIMIGLSFQVFATTNQDNTKIIEKHPVFGVQSFDHKTVEERALEHKVYMQKIAKSIEENKPENGAKQLSKNFEAYGRFDDEDLSDESIFRMLGILEPKKEEPMPPDLKEVLAFNPVEDLKDKISELRYRQIHESAFEYGMQAGLARQNRMISDRLDEISYALDHIYNFQRWIMPGNVLPPVISQVKDAFEQHSDDVIHLGLNNFEMISNPRLVSVAPSWRSYLKHHYENAQKPLLTLNPENNYEKKLWTESVTKGYNRGVMQANRILVQSWRTLQRDYLGLITYHQLLAKGIVSAPYVTAVTNDVVGTNKRMTVGDVTLRIAVKPQFVLERKKWGKYARSGQKGFIEGKGRGAESGYYVELNPRHIK